MLSIILIYLSLTLIGFFLLRTFTKETSLFRILPAGALFAVAIYIFLLNLSTQIIPGRVGIYISASILIFIGIFVKLRLKKEDIQLDKLKSSNLILCLFIYFVVIGLAFLKMSTTLTAADSDMQWAYAASFGKGNNPVRAPWQPDITPAYHLGAYFFEGSLHVLTNLPLRTIHTINNFFLLSGAALMLIFLFWDIKRSFRNFWLLLSGFTVYLAFGVIMIIIPNFGIIQSPQVPDSIVPIITSRNQIPPKVDNNGGGLVDLNSLSFLPARSLGIALSILALYFLLVGWKNKKIKIAVFIVLLSVIALVEESIFLPLYLTILTVVLISFLPQRITKGFLNNNRKWLIIILLFSGLISILQGGFVTEKLLEKNNSTFNLTLPFLNDAFLNKLQRINNYYLHFDSTNPLFNFLIPSPILLILFSFLVSYIKKNSLPLLLGLFSLICFLLFLIIEYRYYPANNIRFFNLGFIVTGFTFFYCLFLLLKEKSVATNLVYLLIFLSLTFPTFKFELSANFKEIRMGLDNKYSNLLLATTHSSSPIELASDWANQHLPLNSRILSLDKNLPTPEGSLAFEYKGIYTLYSPQFVRVIRPEPGPEFFDLALTLNPTFFKQTKVEYLYIESESSIYKQLPPFRKDDLNNSNYFQLLTSIINNKNSPGEEVFYRLYKVKPAFFDSPIRGKEVSGVSLKELSEIIPKNAEIFISDYPAISFWYRMALSLALKEQRLALNRRDHENEDFRIPYVGYQTIETSFNIINDKKDGLYDFYILPPDKKPPVPADMIWSNLFASAWKKI